MTISITPFLMFEGRADEAMTLYAEIIPNAEIVSIKRYGPDADGPEGAIEQATMKLAGQSVRFFDSPIEHDFNFTPSVSLFMDCEGRTQFDTLVAGLSEKGEFLMPVDDYGFSKRYAWLNDRFGVSWQINLA